MSTFGGDAWGPYNINNRRVRQNTILRGINEGEAKQLSNGQWACLVCPSRPVMDTPEMLAVHRNGKKHQAHYETYVELHGITETITDKKRRRDDDDEIESDEKIPPPNNGSREPKIGPTMVPRNVKRQKILNNDGSVSSQLGANRSGFGQQPTTSLSAAKPNQTIPKNSANM